MRILQVSSASNLGGGETHILELVSALGKRGHEVLLAGRSKSPLNPQIELPFRNALDFFSSIKLRSLLREYHFDVVHAHVARDYPVVAAAVWDIPESRLVITRHLLHPVRRHPLYTRIDGWIATTPQILRTLERLSPKASVVIPNWIDLEKFTFRPKPVRKPLTIGLLGQISPHKGHDDALEAMRRLQEGCRLLIGGTGDTAYVASLQQKAAGLPVEFVGFARAPAFFDDIDALVVPSWEEPFGIVLLEAMASGVPVISTNRGGPLEIIRSPEHGILIPPRRPDVLAEAVRSLAADERRRNAIVKNAREHVERNFDIRNVVPRIEDFYRSLTGHNQIRNSKFEIRI